VLAEHGLGLHLPMLAGGLVYIVGITTVVSGGGYLVRWWRTLAGVEANP